MSKLLKLGVYVAAGVGTYEILRRYGLLQKAGQWLSEQVPDEYKDEAREYVGQVRDKAGRYAHQYSDQIRERAGQYGERAHQFANQATDALRSATGYGGSSGGQGQDSGLSEQGGVTGPTSNAGKGNGHTGGPQNLSGPGRGTQANVDEGTGVHISHTVGRGVVR